MYYKSVRNADRGKGVKKSENFADVINGSSLRRIRPYRIHHTMSWRHSCLACHCREDGCSGTNYICISHLSICTSETLVSALDHNCGGMIQSFVFHRTVQPWRAHAAPFHEGSACLPALPARLSYVSCLSSSPVIVAVSVPPCMLDCLPVLHVSNLTKLFCLNQYLARPDASSQEWRKEAHNVTGRQLEEIVGCAYRLQEERNWNTWIAPICNNGGCCAGLCQSVIKSSCHCTQLIPLSSLARH